ncbi:tyrosine kinase receptor Cad96Ca-like [Dendronephthya gigantea]|uniref:tyrosine kinase receptor Cad96Ca-like n=1 Tax=Dendronephthya gigantea TaxID=151771 RepID=UPI00106C1EF5|nr:tyrosine kinase receptor Cad96Ca-like [Dendronephthya gigantea]
MANNEASLVELQSEELTYVRLLNNWEIPPNRLKVLDDILGIGKFGIVKKGLYTAFLGEEPVQVAVKMLKNNPTESDVSDFLDELEMLKKTNKEPHPNVIRFIGACILEEKLMVVTEYCFCGNLQSFLKKRRVIDNSSTSDSKYVKTTSTLDGRQLLKIGVDVASGMVHLSDLKLVHRDLAARNILISRDDNVAKITDFGLTRDIANTEEYMRTNQDLLPVKWMALESLLYGRFTTASDVWSFGVLLYEIVTLGEIPYKHLSPFVIVSYISSGGRLQKPPNCSNEIYKIMMNCWDVDEKKRPSFFQLRKDLHDMLMHDQKSYINVQQVKEEELRTTTTPCHVTVEDEAAIKL